MISLRKMTASEASLRALEASDFTPATSVRTVFDHIPIISQIALVEFWTLSRSPK